MIISVYPEAWLLYKATHVTAVTKFLIDIVLNCSILQSLMNKDSLLTY